MSQHAYDLWQATEAQDVWKRVEEARGTEQMKYYNDMYKDYMKHGQSAQDQNKLIDVAKDLARDPANYQGLFHNQVETWNRMLAAFNLPNNAAPMQEFKKLTSGMILEGLKAFTEGASVGQIRTMEIALSREASATPGNTPEANLALLDINSRLHQRAIDLARMANQWRIDHGQLDENFEKHLMDFKETNPIIPDNLIKEYRETFKRDAEASKGKDKYLERRNIGGKDYGRDERGWKPIGP
jgi:hypothetical protein